MSKKSVFNSKEWQKLYCQKPEVRKKRIERLLRPEIREKIRITQREWSIRNKEVIESKRLFKLYGITLLDYNIIFDKQQGRCAICEIHQIELTTKLHVDHNHNTGRVRGLLCYNCNRALGLLKDNEKIINSAAKYIADYEWD